MFLRLNTPSFAERDVKFKWWWLLLHRVATPQQRTRSSNSAASENMKNRATALPFLRGDAPKAVVPVHT